MCQGVLIAVCRGGRYGAWLGARFTVMDVDMPGLLGE